MRRLFYTLAIIAALHSGAYAQKTEKSAELNELAAPNSPAFMLLDVSPSLVESPSTPKEFTFAALQAFAEGQGFPQNFAVEFTPYWWLRPSGRDVYAFAGLDRNDISKQKPFSGLKFSSISMAFVNKDLIPDQIDQEQKIFSVGFHSNIIKIQQPGYAKALTGEISKWHKTVQGELAVMQEAINQENDPVKQRKLQQELTDKVWPVSKNIASNINRIINQKPLFSWNVSAAYSVYGIDNNRFETGRTGVWTTLATFVPFGKRLDEIPVNYLNLLVYSRYMQDEFMLGADNLVTSSNSIDLGGKIGFQISRVSLAWEYIERDYRKATLGSSNRNVGIVSYRLNNNLYINGTFGEDFGPVEKIVTLFGINWGFGEEKVDLPSPNLQ
ncbi:hypothetical protein GZH53_12570 [Flavihumibacter sp. R14]|nr:hypothetical protein [Flavihumibacter soli]